MTSIIASAAQTHFTTADYRACGPPRPAELFLRTGVISEGPFSLPARREVPVGELPDEPDEGLAPTCGCSLTLLAGLPPTYAEILRRIDLDGAGVDEVAAVLGITRSNVAVRLFRARRALRSRLEQHCGVTSSRECTRCVCAERGCCAT